MCTVIVGIAAHPNVPLFFAANRDEWRARPSAPFGKLATDPLISGGRDLKASGTWFGIRADEGMAFLTNIRPGANADPKKKSRGEIALDLLRAEQPDDMAARAKRIVPADYNPFNVLFGRGDRWFWLKGDGTGELTPVAPGVHVLGNLALDHPDDEKTAFVRQTFANINQMSKSNLAETLTSALQSDTLTVDAGPYGTRWSMLFAREEAASHGTLWVAEDSIRNGPWRQVKYR